MFIFNYFLLIHDIYGNNCEKKKKKKRYVFTNNYFSSQYPAFSVAKIACKTKAGQNQVCEVRLISRLKLFHFRQCSRIRPLRYIFSTYIVDHLKCIFSRVLMFVYVLYSITITFWQIHFFHKKRVIFMWTSSIFRFVP